MGNISARELRRVLLEHVHEIAGTAAGAPGDTLVLATVADDGRWLGAQVVSPAYMPPESEQAVTEGFFLPTDCRTPDQARQFIAEALGDIEDEEREP